MATDNETVEEIVEIMRGPYYKMGRSNARLDHEMMGFMSFIANRIEAAHKRDREAARRRAERSAIYNMLESFPYDWECNSEAVKKWLAMWQRNADDLCEGGKYAK